MFTAVPTPEEMARWDASAIAFGMPEDVLMENAARAAMECLRRRFPLRGGDMREMRVLLLAGSGNNGGDAFCMARHLADAGAMPAVVLVRPPRPGGAAARWLEVLRRMPVPIVSADAWLDETAQVLGGTPPDVVIDGLLGTGFHGQLREMEFRLVEKINGFKGYGTFIFAVDIPSGIHGVSGKPSPIAVEADATVSFHAPKPGLLMPDSSAYTGMTEICSIGMPSVAADEGQASFRTWLLPEQVKKHCAGAWQIRRGYTSADAAPPGAAPRPSAHGPAHKGAAGKIVVIGGCPAYAGAPCLSALGAFRAGAGLVTVAGPDPVPAVLRATCPAAITAVLPSRRQGDGWLASDAAMLIPSLLRADVIVLGPGLGRGDEEEKLVADLLEVPRRPPMVIDADALFAISRRPGLLKHLTDRDILTPHPGEAAALLGTTVNDVQLDRVEALRSLTRNCPSVCILKGEGTLIGRRGEATVISPWSVPQLAVAGSGDVLAGLAAALLARRSNAMEAAAIAVWAHALAGLDLSQAFPMRGNTPQDIANAIPMAMAAAGA